MDGILPLYKERGMTSNDAVIKCRKIFKTRKIGHSGTLDPEVDGVLPICVGKATKVVNYLMDSGKGEVISKVKLSEPFSDEKINEILSSSIGDIIQVPPIYSAIKVNGKKLYEYARAGEKVDIPERRVHIEYFKQIFPSKFDKEKGQQTIYFEVGCGKGTYVRTLAVDVGKKLGVPAVMSDLTRLKSGGFQIGMAKSLSQLEKLAHENKLSESLYPIDYAVKDLPRYDLKLEQWKIVKNGGFLSVNTFKENYDRVNLFYDDRIRCIYQYNKEKNRYQSERMIDLS